MSVLRFTPEEHETWLKRRGKLGVPVTLDPDAARPAPRPAGIKVKTRRQRERADGVAMLLMHIAGAGLRKPVLEFRFHDTRQWRSDFAWPEQMLLAEFEGGIWQNGAHVRGLHYEGDCRKYNEAALMGYRVLRFTIDMVTSGEALKALERALCR